MEFGLSAKTCATVRQILADCPQIKQAILYGSRAKGNYREGSDIDLTLIAPGMSHPQLMALAWALDESDIPYTVDLSLLDQINHPALREHIERVGQVFYRRAPTPL